MEIFIATNAVTAQRAMRPLLQHQHGK